jgi:hypothetical protein
MDSDQIEILRRIAIANAETANLLLKIEAMKVENKIRKLRNESPAYDEASFMAESNMGYVSSLLHL